MAKRFYLHIGNPKTGTSTLQRAFKENRGYLRKQNILYPEVLAPSNSHAPLNPYLTTPGNPGHPMWRRVTDNPDELARESQKSWEHVKAQVANEDWETLIISDEMLSGRFFRDTDGQLVPAMKSLYPDVTVVYYIRDVCDQYLSMAQQLIKHTPKVPRPNRNRYEKVVTRVREAEFGTLHVRHFDRSAMVGGDILNDFCTAFLPEIDVDRLSIAKPEANSSLSPEAMALNLEFIRGNCEGFPDPDRQQKLKFLQSLYKHDRSVEGWARPALNPAVAAAILTLNTDIAFVADAFGHDLTGGKTETCAPEIAEATFAGIQEIADICAVDTERQEALWHVTMPKRDGAKRFWPFSKRA